jgi:peptidoglycan/LPS O-acetylase OafA/YrhL
VAVAARPRRGDRRLGRQPGLDGLRAVAVLLVVGYHVTDVLKPVPFLPVFNGALGVDLFFVLSGFLITALLARERDERGKVRFGAFYRRRALRLLPALFVLLIAFLVYESVTDLVSPYTKQSVISVLLYVSNWQFTLHLQMTPYLGHLWSLSVEEQFYLVWPFVAVVLLGFVKRLWIIVVILLTAIALIAVNRSIRYHDMQSTPLGYLLVYGRTDARADALLVGALFAHLWVRHWTPKRMLWPFAVMATVVLGLCVARTNSVDPFLYDGGFTLVALAGGVLIISVIDSNWIGARAMRWRVLGAIGLVSYGIYLWHIPVFFAVARYGPEWEPWQRVAVGLGVTTVIVVASWFLIERPALVLKDRFEKRRA